MNLKTLKRLMSIALISTFMLYSCGETKQVASKNKSENTATTIAETSPKVPFNP